MQSYVHFSVFISYWFGDTDDMMNRIIFLQQQMRNFSSVTPTETLMGLISVPAYRLLIDATQINHTHWYFTVIQEIIYQSTIFSPPWAASPSSQAAALFFFCSLPTHWNPQWLKAGLACSQTLGVVGVFFFVGNVGDQQTRQVDAHSTGFIFFVSTVFIGKLLSCYITATLVWRSHLRVIFFFTNAFVCITLLTIYRKKKPNEGVGGGRLM